MLLPYLSRNNRNVLSHPDISRRFELPGPDCIFEPTKLEVSSPRCIPLTLGIGGHFLRMSHTQLQFKRRSTKCWMFFSTTRSGCT